MKKVILKQIRSSKKRVDRVQDTLKALGLGRIGKQRTHVLNPCVQGMIRKVEHLLDIQSEK